MSKENFNLLFKTIAMIVAAIVALGIGVFTLSRWTTRCWIPVSQKQQAYRDVEALLWVVVGRTFCCEKYDFSEFCGLCPIQKFFNKIRKLKSNSIFNPELKLKMWTS